MKLDEAEAGPKEPKYAPSSKPYFKKSEKPSAPSKILSPSGAQFLGKSGTLNLTGKSGKSGRSDYEPPKEYEEVIQKLEADIRTHIRVEQQLKLHIETVHNKLEELERRVEEVEREKVDIQRKRDLEMEQVLGNDFELTKGQYLGLEGDFNRRGFLGNMNLMNLKAVSMICIGKLRDKERKCEEVEKLLEYEKELLEEKNIKYDKLEQRLHDLEDNYQKELKFMQKEVSRFQDDNHRYKNQAHNISTGGEHLTTYTHRKVKQGDGIFKSKSNNATPIAINYNSQKHFISQQKVMSISNNSMGGGILNPGPQSTKKKTQNVRKLKGEIQKNLIKNYFMSKSELENGMFEVSTRTPDKTNTELSPYMMDFYKKKSSIHEDPSKIRSSGTSLKYSSKAQDPPPDSSIQNPIYTHKKSKSQTSIVGMKSMDSRSSQVNLAENQENRVLDWKQSLKFLAKKKTVSHKRHLTEPKVAVISIPKNLYNTYHKKFSIRKSEKRKNL